MDKLKDSSTAKGPRLTDTFNFPKNYKVLSANLGKSNQILKWNLTIRRLDQIL